MNSEKCCENCTKSKHRTDVEKQKISKRLNIIEGQVRGIKQMIDDDRYCDDVLIQISAINRSLKTLGMSILKSHMETCMVEDIQNGRVEVIDEITDLIGRFSL